MTRNVVLLCLDSVRMDVFEEFASRIRERADIEFTQCRAASSWSPPSHASMFTGQLPHQHGVHTHNQSFAHLSRADTFVSRLPDHRALGASANVYASSAHEFDAFFDEFSDVSPHRRFPEGLDVVQFGMETDDEGLAKYRAFVEAALAHDHPIQSLANGAVVTLDDLFARLPLPKPTDDGAAVVSRSIQRLVEETTEPYFMFANYMDAHAPHCHVRGYDRSLHDAPNAWHSESLDTTEINANGYSGADEQAIECHRGLYRASVEYLDRRIDALVDRLDELSDLETTVVVTADHGENLCYPSEGGMIEHFGSLSEGLLHVPLCVINAPGGQTCVRTELFSHLDLGELVVGLAGDEVPELTREHIAAERMGSRMPSDHSYDPERVAWLERSIRAVYEGDRKYEWDSLDGRVVYRLDAERPSWQERIDSESFDPVAYDACFDESIGVARERALQSRSETDRDDATMQRLQDLGYL